MPFEFGLGERFLFVTWGSTERRGFAQTRRTRD